MIEVKYELEGDIDKRAAERKVERVVRFHQNALDGLTCSMHGKEPCLRVRGRSVDRLNISIESCCESLAELALSRIKDISRRDQE